MAGGPCDVAFDGPAQQAPTPGIFLHHVRSPVTQKQPLLVDKASSLQALRPNIAARRPYIKCFQVFNLGDARPRGRAS